LLQIWKQIESKGLSVREVEKLARVRGISRGMRQKARGLAQDINIIEQNLQSILGAPVRVVVKRRGGEIRIMFHSHEDMDRILDRLATLGERA
jgi:hypothetical protein